MELHELSPLSGPLLERLRALLVADDRYLGLTVGGSGSTGELDEHSDLDLVIVCRDDAHPELLAGLPTLAAQIGPLLVAFTGEHVQEPRLVIALYGPPVLHVDLKLVAASDLVDRVEDGLVLWDRDGTVTRAHLTSAPVWPTPDLQWIEDRFWVWIHYGATKIARGELLECLDVLSMFRGRVHGPLNAVAAGRRPQGVRRMEALDPVAAHRLAAVIGDHTPDGCIDALRSAIELYREQRQALRGPITLRAEAERRAVAHLDAVATSHGHPVR